MGGWVKMLGGWVGQKLSESEPKEGMLTWDETNVYCTNMYLAVRHMGATLSKCRVPGRTLSANLTKPSIESCREGGKGNRRVRDSNPLSDCGWDGRRGA